MNIGQLINNKKAVWDSVKDDSFAAIMRSVAQELVKAEDKARKEINHLEKLWVRKNLQHIYDNLDEMNSHQLAEKSIALDKLITRFDKNGADCSYDKEKYMILDHKPMKIYHVYQSLAYCSKRLRDMGLYKRRGSKWSTFAGFILNKSVRI